MSNEYTATPGRKGNVRYIVTEEEIGEGHTHSIECFGNEDVLF